MTDKSKEVALIALQTVKRPGTYERVARGKPFKAPPQEARDHLQAGRAKLAENAAPAEPAPAEEAPPPSPPAAGRKKAADKD